MLIGDNVDEELLNKSISKYLLYRELSMKSLKIDKNIDTFIKNVC